MNGVLIAFEIALLLPLFIGTWRTSLVGLSAQGFLMAWIAFRHGVAPTPEAAVEVIDLVILRGIAIPALLYREMRAQNAARRNDVIAPNLLSWVLALTLVLMSFRAADLLVPSEGDGQALIGVATSALLIGLLVLATRTGHFSQMLGALRVENAIALFTVGSAPHTQLGVRIGETLVLFATILYFRGYLAALGAEAPADSVTEPIL